MLYLAKVGVEGSNPFARSNFLLTQECLSPRISGERVDPAHEWREPCRSLAGIEPTFPRAKPWNRGEVHFPIATQLEM